MPTLAELMRTAGRDQSRRAMTHSPQAAADTRPLAVGALLGASMIPGAGMTDAAGYFPSPDGGFEPSLPQNMREGSYLQAALQALGVGGDVLTGLGPAGAAIGMAAKAPRVAQLAKKARAPKAIGSIYDAVTDPAEAIRMALRGDHIKRDASGSLVGAPQSVNSPQQLGAMRRAVDAKASDGAFNADWYDRARMAAQDLTGDPATQNLFARGTAAYSPQATPSEEVNYFVRQFNDRQLGTGQVRPRTASAMVNVDRGIASGDGDAVRLGKKTGPYADAKNPTIPDESLYKTANDIWHGRVFGYTDSDGSQFSRGFTPQEHGFLTGENLLMSDRLTKAGVPVGSMPEGTPWTPRRGQAATWGAERERQFIDKAQKAAGGRELTPGELTEIRKRAAYGIDDAVERNTAYLTGEYVPGASLQHLDGIKDLPEEARAAFSLERSRAMSDPAGRSLLLTEGAGMLSRPALPARGEYVNSAGVTEFNPMFADRPLVGLQPAGKARGGGPTVQAGDAAALDALANLQGLTTVQEGAPWHKITPKNSSMTRAGQTGARSQGPAASMAPLKSILEQRGLGLVDTGDGYSVMDFSGNLSGKDIQARIKQAMKDLNAQGPSGVSMQPGRKDGGYAMPFADDAGAAFAPGSGGATQKMLDQVGAVPNLEGRLDSATQWRAALEKLNELDAGTAAQTGMPVRPDITRLRQIISRDGIAGLRAWVAKNGPAGLPAVLLPFVAGQGEEAPAE